MGRRLVTRRESEDLEAFGCPDPDGQPGLARSSSTVFVDPGSTTLDRDRDGPGAARRRADRHDPRRRARADLRPPGARDGRSVPPPAPELAFFSTVSTSQPPPTSPGRSWRSKLAAQPTRTAVFAPYARRRRADSERRRRADSTDPGRLDWPSSGRLWTDRRQAGSGL